MDDLLVHNISENDHLEHSKMIFQNIREAGLKLKCTFFKRCLQYLGHLISGKGIYPLKGKDEIILNLVLSKDATKSKTHNRISLLL